MTELSLFVINLRSNLDISETLFGAAKASKIANFFPKSDRERSLFSGKSDK